MWREFILDATQDAIFSPPASLSEIAEVEARFGVALPPDLRALLLETNGVTIIGNSYFAEAEKEETLHWRVVCSAQGIVKFPRRKRRGILQNPEATRLTACLHFIGRVPMGHATSSFAAKEPPISRKRESIHPTPQAAGHSGLIW